MTVGVTTAHPSSLLELLDLARAQVRPETVRHHVMHDPGTGGYIAAFSEVLRRGLPAIEPSFDLVENLGGGVNWLPAGNDSDYRWFRVLTATIALILRDEAFVRPTHQPLASLLVDAVGLGPPPRSRRTPSLREVLLRLCREFPPLLADPREGAAFVLGELILLGLQWRDADPAVIVARCAELERISGECEAEALPGDEWRPNPYHARSTLGPWGWATETTLHPVWVELVAQHFPAEPAPARVLKQRILADGAKWANKPRRLS